jgi:hypothetical protein
MHTRRTGWRGCAAAALIAAGLAAGSAQAYPVESAFVKGRLVQVDVYDRADGIALPVYSTDGRSFIVGAPGHEYAVRIRNCTGGRVLVVTSVDGVNVVSGDTAAPSQSGYVLDPWGSVEIAGWRKSFERTAAFYFTDLGNSYAARTGRPDNVGVIGVAVFEERVRPIAWSNLRDRIGAAAPAAREATSAESDAASAPGSARNESAAPGSGAAPLAAAPPAQSRADAEMAQNAPGARDQPAPERTLLGKLGTGHGRSEESRVTTVNFERASSAPAETVALQYDRRENLVAMGMLPPTHHARRSQPDPFPGTWRFAPDPGR